MAIKYGVNLTLEAESMNDICGAPIYGIRNKRTIFPDSLSIKASTSWSNLERPMQKNLMVSRTPHLINIYNYIYRYIYIFIYIYI